jgi:alpha-mannosidase
MAPKPHLFPLGPGGAIQHWLGAGLFVDLLIPSSPPGEGEPTAGEPWSLFFTRFRRVQVPGCRGQSGTWWLAVCGLRAEEEVEAQLTVSAPAGAQIGVESLGFRPASEGPYPLRLSPLPRLLVVAVPVQVYPQTFSACLQLPSPEVVQVVLQLEAGLAFRLGRVVGRDVWIEHQGRPCPTVWLEILNISARPLANLRVALVTSQEEVLLADHLLLEAQSAQLWELPYPPEVSATRGAVVVSSRHACQQAEVALPRTSPHWQVHLVPYFGYRPVGRLPQASSLEGVPPAGFDVLSAYLRAAQDEELPFVLQQVPLVKPYWDCFPAQRAGWQALLHAGRLQLAGALYNHPQSTLLGLETTLRNICYGTLYHRWQFGAEELDGAVLESLGHAPILPQLLAAAGHKTIAYSHGPYQCARGWVASHLNFPVDHFWMGPDGSRVLARLLEPPAYGAGESLQRYGSAEEAWWQTANLFEEAAAYPAAPVQLWLLSGEAVRPLPWLSELVRLWNQRHVSPKLYLSTPARFFARLEEVLAGDGAAVPVLTRDLSPVSNGDDVSYPDTKLAHRRCQQWLSAAEALATLAACTAGVPWPACALDLAWRQLLYNSDRDALGGRMSDRVYVDLVAGWREAYEVARQAAGEAMARLTAAGAGQRLTVFNPLPWRRDDVVEIELPAEWPGAEAQVVEGERVLPAHVSGGVRRLLRFVARDVPALGARTYTVRPQAAPPSPQLAAGPTYLENEFFRVQIDPQRGGGISSLFDKQAGRELVAPGRVLNDLVAHREYRPASSRAELCQPLLPTGEQVAASEHFPAQVSLEASAACVSVCIRSPHVNCQRQMRLTLWAGLPRVDCEVLLFDYSGSEWLFKLHFPWAVRGGRPLGEVAGAVVSRSYCAYDPDAKQARTQDSAVHHWLDLTVPLLLEGVVGIGGEVVARASAGMAEIICPSTRSMEPTSPVSQLVLALASLGVTATVTWPSYRRYGDLAWDSNVPDFRLLIGGPEDNEFVHDALATVGKAVAAELSEWVKRHRWVVALLPAVEMGLPAELPMVLVWGADGEAEQQALEHVAAQVRERAKIVCLVPAALRPQGPPLLLDEGGVVLLNRGTPSHCCYPDQTVTMALLRSPSPTPADLAGEESGFTCPGGSSFRLQPWGHRWEYAFLPHREHWRTAHLARRGYEFNQPLLAVWGEPGQGLQAGVDYLVLEPATVVATAIKPAGAAVGYPVPPPPAGRRLVVRLQETAGQPTEATLTAAWPVAAAWKCNGLEEPREELSIAAGVVRVPLGQFEVATVMLELGEGVPAFNWAAAGGARPQYVRWWRYNRGEAPLGWMPAVVLFDEEAPRRAEPGDTFSVGLTVAAAYTRAEVPVSVKLVAPEGWQIEEGEYELRLPPQGQQRRSLTVTIPASAAPGQYVLLACLTAPSSVPLYDVLQVSVGAEPGPLCAAEIEKAPADAPAGAAQVHVRVRNLSRCPLAGEVVLISPVEAWELYEQATQSFSVAAGRETTVSYALAAPLHELRGWVWALAKVMVAGQVRYTESIRIDLAPSTQASPADA